MSQMIESGGSVSTRREDKRDNLIRESMKDLSEGKITVVEFLNLMTYEENHISSSMASCYIPDGYISDSEPEPDEVALPVQIIDPTSDSASDNEALCIVCTDRNADTVYLPCRHMKCCQECSSLLAAQSENGFSCPFCKQSVATTLVVFV